MVLIWLIKWVFYKFFFIINFFVIYKKAKILIQKNRDVILNRAKDYYENNKERLRVQARDKCRNLSEEEKNKVEEYGKNRYRNMSEEKKQKTKRISKKLSKELSWDKKSLNTINKIILILTLIVFLFRFNSAWYLSIHY